ncbi:hypothetical protein [Pseudocolwellia sp. HL-MZ7]|uniref:hypothetical protein n=1 Tax=Pseudocolwellia sp. HL-MZ7 TaxID=3400627 RepID=UPI003CEB432F
MKIRNYLLGALAIILCGNAYIAISAEDLEGVTMKLAQKETKRGHRVQMRAHQIIADYMLKNGDMTQDELDAMKEERRTLRSELKRLKKSGDMDAFKARLTEIKQAHEAKRELMKEYVHNHPELDKILRDTHIERHGEKDGARDGERKGERRGDMYKDRKHGENDEGDQFDDEKRKKHHKKPFEEFESDEDLEKDAENEVSN